MEQLTRIWLHGLTEADEERLCLAIQRMQHLHYLQLGSLPQGSELGEHTISHIQALPNLLKLNLVENAFVGERLCFVAGFKKLQHLRLRGLSELKEIAIANGVMLALEVLTVLRCKELRRLPHGWKHQTHLKRVLLYDVSSELVESICGKGTDHLPATPRILLTRTDDEDEARIQSKWVHRVVN
ncbi:hypothetical protein V6N12_064365 [Hibiscus sabdariffa]|uniref:Uncharacterized protein n=1 Tax=Hibiscus sabdariffa TaxID=183260 RepID=A0ABR2G5J5_9ROSI